jgi:Bacterial regulatory proteins, luxR family
MRVSPPPFRNHLIRKRHEVELRRSGPTELHGRYASLTPRERDVLTRIVAGLLDKQIAGQVGHQRGHRQGEARTPDAEDAGWVCCRPVVRFASRLGIPSAGSGVPGQGREWPDPPKIG